VDLSQTDLSQTIGYNRRRVPLSKTPAHVGQGEA
jgi:hypothetical protein